MSLVQSDRHVSLVQSDRHVSLVQSDRHVSLVHSDRHVSLVQSEAPLRVHDTLKLRPNADETVDESLRTSRCACSFRFAR